MREQEGRRLNLCTEIEEPSLMFEHAKITMESAHLFSQEKWAYYDTLQSKRQKTAMSEAKHVGEARRERERERGAFGS